MPSPVGHALGGIAAGTLLTDGSRRSVVVLAILGAAADLDLLAGAHRGPSHSVGAALLAAALALAVTRSPRWSLATGLAWGSHVLLDWLGQDSWPPLGIPALWPFSHAYFQSPIVIFPAVSRQYWLGLRFVRLNATALGVELLLLLPIAWIACRAAKRDRVGRAEAKGPISRVPTAHK